jgi:hypothetical protein
MIPATVTMIPHNLAHLKIFQPRKAAPEPQHAPPAESLEGSIALNQYTCEIKKISDTLYTGWIEPYEPFAEIDQHHPHEMPRLQYRLHDRYTGQKRALLHHQSKRDGTGTVDLGEVLNSFAIEVYLDGAPQQHMHHILKPLALEAYGRLKRDGKKQCIYRVHEMTAQDY